MTRQILFQGGHYARLCVEEDLLKLLVAKFKPRRRVKRLEYERLHLVCFCRGLYGHRKESRPLEKSENPTVPENTSEGGTVCLL